jgi:hypothetical protein
VKPRLKQPLFAEPSQAAAKKDPLLAETIRAYDVIWNLLYRPEEISAEQRKENATVVMEALGVFIEDYCGVEPFEFDPSQLYFPDEIMEPLQPAVLDEPGVLLPFSKKLE